MTSLRHAIRAYAVQGDDPPTVLARLNDLVDIERDDCFATVLCARSSISERTVELVSAGHLPPLLLDRDGARFVTLQVGIPIGVAQRLPTAPVSTWLSLSPGSLLALYTDGLVERRDAPLDLGLETLRATAAAAGLPDAQGLATALGGAVGESLDDVAILVVRWSTDDPVSHARDGALRCSFPGRHDAIAAAREFVLSAVGTVARQPDTAALLVSELATNAVLHASSSFDVIVTPRPDRSAVRVTVRDEGPGEVRLREVQLDARGGFGLRLVEHLASAWGVEPTAGGKAVWFELPGIDAHARPE